MPVMFIVIAALVFIALCVSAFVLYAYIDAWLEVKAKPRADMEFCTKHGFFPTGTAVNIPVAGGPTVNYCPRCYLESLKGN